MPPSGRGVARSAGGERDPRCTTDFYCHRARLVVELDGSQHYSEEARAYDERRTAFLATQGVEVLRLQNRTIDEFFHLAMAKIAERAAEREEPRRRSAASEGRVLPPPLRGTPLPEGGIHGDSRRKAIHQQSHPKD